MEEYLEKICHAELIPACRLEGMYDIIKMQESPFSPASLHYAGQARSGEQILSADTTRRRLF